VFIDEVLGHGHGDSMTAYVSSETSIQHSPKLADRRVAVAEDHAGGEPSDLANTRPQ
jgi:hypothetical protein